MKTVDGLTRIYGAKALEIICKYQQIQSADDFSISTEVAEDSVAIITNMCLALRII